jgi:hypothetical protein
MTVSAAGVANLDPVSVGHRSPSPPAGTSVEGRHAMTPLWTPPAVGGRSLDTPNSDRITKSL